MNNRSSLYNQSPLPPILAFGDYEKYAHSNETPVVEYYDYNSQMTIHPFFCGSDKKVTKSAENVGSWFSPKYKNVVDDAKEK
ncbi:MAG: hypothetical protein IKJ81_06445 [Bacteroidales bacterium]|nr:hypothetical protein [Bacteroidales bacterium]